MSGLRHFFNMGLYTAGADQTDCAGGAILGPLSDHCGGRRACIIVSFTLCLIPALLTIDTCTKSLSAMSFLVLFGIIGILIGGPNNIITSVVAIDLAQHPYIRGDRQACKVFILIASLWKLVILLMCPCSGNCHGNHQRDWFHDGCTWAVRSGTFAIQLWVENSVEFPHCLRHCWRCTSFAQSAQRNIPRRYKFSSRGTLAKRHISCFIIATSDWQW